mmetsp:Transcript_3689/g.23149  ORF Transcript_3689/g.23149 Transcript_3689/m.23149 type:complete len:93 (-) Transcript_3689:822-1100(-)
MAASGSRTTDAMQRNKAKEDEKKNPLTILADGLQGKGGIETREAVEADKRVAFFRCAKKDRSAHPSYILNTKDTDAVCLQGKRLLPALPGSS